MKKIGNLFLILIMIISCFPVTGVNKHLADELEILSSLQNKTILINDETILNEEYIVSNLGLTTQEVVLDQNEVNQINNNVDGTITTISVNIDNKVYNVKVVKTGSNVTTNGQIAMYANNINADHDLSIEEIIVASNLKAIDMISANDVTNEVVISRGNDSLTFSLNGVTKTVTYNVTAPIQTETLAKEENTNPNGSEEGSENEEQPSEPTVDANIEVTNVKITPESAKNIKELNDLVSLLNATATEDGNPLNIEVVCDDFAAIQAGELGVYTVVFKAQLSNGETIETQGLLTIAKFEVVEQTGKIAFINAENKLLTVTQASDITSSKVLVTLMNAEAKVNGKKFDDITVSCSDEDKLLAHELGDYQITFSVDADNNPETENDNASVTKTITIVSDDTLITPDGKGYIDAYNFLITTDEAKQITNSSQFKDIHGVIGKYDAENLIINCQIDDLVKIKNGLQGIYDVTFSIDGDGNKDTKEDQVEITKRLSVVINTKGELQEYMRGPVEGQTFTYINSIFNYEEYTKEQRIEGKFVLLNTYGYFRINGMIHALPTYNYKKQEFMNLSYEEFMNKMCGIVMGINGEYVDVTNIKFSQGLETGWGTQDHYGDDKNPAVYYEWNEEQFNIFKEEINRAVFKDYENGCEAAAGIQVIPLFNSALYVSQIIGNNGEIVLDKDDLQYANGGRDGDLFTYLTIYKDDCIEAPEDYLDPNYNDIRKPINAESSKNPSVDKNILSGSDQVIVKRSEIKNDKDTLAKLLAVKVLTPSGEEQPQNMELSGNIPEYGVINPTFSYENLTFTGEIVIYPDTAVLNQTGNGYVDGKDNMITQKEFFGLKSEDEFFNVIKASSAINANEFSNPKLTCDNLEGLRKGQVGSYELTISNQDNSATKTVLLTIRPNNSIPTKDNKGYITGAGSFITEDQAKQLTDVNQLPSQNSIQAIYNGDQMLVDVVTSDFDKIHSGIKGIYPITYILDADGDASTTDDRAEITFNLAVADNDSAFTGDGKGFISAEDATISVTQARSLASTNDLVTIMEAFAYYDNAEQAPIVVKTDFDAIKQSNGGQYNVTFLLDGANNPVSRTGTNGLLPHQAEITRVLTVTPEPTNTVSPQVEEKIANTKSSTPSGSTPTGVVSNIILLTSVIVISAVVCIIRKRNN